MYLIQPNRNMFKAFKCFVFTIVSIALMAPIYAQTVTFYETGEEFAGPFPSWKNVKTDFPLKAIGDGVANDGPAIQAALNAMRTTNSNTWAVLYFPAGTYKIDATLETRRIDPNTDYNGFSIIGQDPATTIIKYNGQTGANIMNIDGWYCKVARLTFDGQSKAATGIMRDGAFSTYAELNDLFFKDMTTGIALGGSTDQGQAECAIERCRFTRCAKGITTNNYNVMDIYIWYCLFEDCGSGVFNNAGAYHAINNVFLRSTTSDFGSNNLFTFDLINNISVGSKCFTSGWWGTMYIQGNRIYNTTNAIAITTSQDNAVLLNNTILSSANHTGAAVALSAAVNLLAGNTYNVQVPVAKGASKSFTVDQRIVAASTIAVPTTITLPGTPPNKNRKIFEVAKGTGNDGKAIQDQIVLAATEPAGSNPIVHIPKGTFAISSTILVPRNKDIQIVGDGASGHATQITRPGTVSGPAFRFMGPSRVTMRDVWLNFASATTDGIQIDSCDQAGGRVFMDQVLSYGLDQNMEANTTLLVDGVENSDITYINAGFGTSITGMLVKGGPVLKAGGVTSGQVSCLLGSFSLTGNTIIDLVDGGRAVAIGFRNEASFVNGNAKLTSASSGALTIAGMSWASAEYTGAPFQINGFKGTFAYLGNGTTVNTWSHPLFDISGDGTNCKVLSAANWTESSSSFTDATAPDVIWKDNSSPAAQATMLYHEAYSAATQARTISLVSNKVKNVEPDSQLVLSCLEQIRNLRIEPPMNRAAGVTDVKLFRTPIFASKDKIGITFKGGYSVGVIDNIYGNHINQISGPRTFVYTVGKAIIIPAGTKNISVFDVKGRMLFAQQFTGNFEANQVVQQIKNLSTKGVVFVRLAQ